MTDIIPMVHISLTAILILVHNERGSINDEHCRKSAFLLGIRTNHSPSRELAQ